MSEVLIISSVFYKDIADISLKASKDILASHNMSFKTIIVPGAFEIPSVANMALENYDFRGLIILGCVIKGETNHYDIVCNECARGVNEVAAHYSVPMGFGLITAQNKKQADSRAEDYAKRATNACLELIKIKGQLNSFDHELYGKYNN